MALPTNVQQTVERYLNSNLALLLNQNPLYSRSNKKFMNFQNEVGQLGTTVGFSLPYRVTANNSLAGGFQPAEQRKKTMTVDTPWSVKLAYNDLEWLYNFDKYQDDIQKSVVAELGVKAEMTIASKIVPNTFRYYTKAGSTTIDSFQKLSEAITQFRTFGAAPYNTMGFLPDIDVDPIIGSGLSQFVPDRNEKLALDWKLGTYKGVPWHQSNLLPVHTAGNVGQLGTTLTVTTEATNAAGAITGITVSGATTDPDAIKANDVFTFNDPTSGTKPRFLTFIGHEISSAVVQNSAVADAASVTNLMDITFSYPLYPTPDLVATAANKRNLNVNTLVGLTLNVEPSHRVGFLISGDAMYCAMPRLPETNPYDSKSVIDPSTGAAMRMYWGFIPAPGETSAPTQGVVHDFVQGAEIVNEYAFRLCFPL